ncbi:MAG TPA: DUF3793 family protein [Candidatus Merdenecus merdavium]|nr:DUF3793 family protein [Candidatus Merdenecus merdavium]
MNHTLKEKEKIYHSLDERIALHCAPVIMGIKTANTITIFRRELEELISLLNHTGIQIIKLCECKEKNILMLYRDDLLRHQLHQKPQRRFLASYGYKGTMTFDEMLYYLVKRFRGYIGKGEEFPHELGVFLQYPMEDLLAFIKYGGKNCKITGYWKVYENVEYALSVFKSYDQAKENVLQYLDQGMNFEQITKRNRQQSIA